MIRFFRFVFTLSVVGCVLWLASCTKDKAAEFVPPPPDSTCIPTGYTVTYSVDIKPILETYCTDPSFGSCHQSIQDGGSGFDYTIYDGIKFEVDNGQLENHMFVLKDMPKVITLGPTTLTDCELLKIQTWIDEGAPE